MEDFYVYILINDQNYSYIGVTNNLEKRIKAHNNKTGSKFTRIYNNWKYYKIYKVSTKSEAYSFEWYCKHKKTKKNTWNKVSGGIDKKIEHINNLLLDPRWVHIREHTFVA